MFLKSLQLKGFKSFADKTTLELEPGVTVIIGPNGSGKSNVVDAVAWVLGAQGARALRGAKMDDVIFAGTADRPALGRAEVSLTIDNTSGVLPIEFSEVTLTRRLFRTGDSDYEINGVPCRLLDLQELLSDTGIGRQQHVIVGQGQLDAVLNARPEDRRSIIEEAAGILKYRKRKEKAERRLEATEGNLLRLTDLLREVRRQLRPLERQAEAARRHGALVAELHAARLHLAGREIDQLRARQERQQSRRVEAAQRESELRGALRTLDARVVAAEKHLTVSADDDAADALLRVEQLRERGRGLRALVVERARGIERELLAAADEGVVETLVADADALRAELAEVDSDFASLAPTRAEVDAAERRVQALRAELDAATNVAPELSGTGRARRAAEDDVEAVAAAWRDAEAELSALTRADETLRRDEPRLATQLAQAADALAGIAGERDALDRAEAEAEAARSALDADANRAGDETAEGRALRDAERALDEATTAAHDAQAAAARWRARADTLQLALDEAHAAAGGAAIRQLAGVVGPLIDQLQIEPGAEVAVAAALGETLHAIVVDGGDAVRSAVEQLKRGDTSALLVVLDERRAHGAQQQAMVPSGSRALADVVRANPPALDGAVRALLADIVLVSDWQHALDLAVADAGLIAVTPDGDRFGGGGTWRAGPSGRSAVTPAAYDEARDQAIAAESARDAATAAMISARDQVARAKQAEQLRHDTLRARRREVDRAIDDVTRRRRDFERRTAGLDERHAQLAGRLQEIETSRAGMPAAIADATARRDGLAADLEAARQRLAAARRAELVETEALRAKQSELDRVRTGATALRRDFEVRGAGIDQRRAVLAKRLADVDRRLAARPDEEAAAQARRHALTERLAAVGTLGTRLGELLGRADELAARLHERRRRQSEAARAAGLELDSLRTERSQTEHQLAEVRERLSRLEVEQAEVALRLETVVDQVRRDFDCEPDAALEAPRPELADDVTVAQHARELDRELRMLGPINPLALSEYEALLERHEFLADQLDDVKKSRRELQRVITAVNAEIVATFESAYTDVARHFDALFALLFPGGSGRLLLTDPDDLLDSGVEVEARPSGKMPRRLSLLSGGERSLAALAFLFAVFRARPSPFYLLDEVEAALDDVNLHRFLDLVHEFRNDAQLLIVSHQKRTMESADVLYGVSMPPGGSSRVVSQRMRDLQLEEI